MALVADMIEVKALEISTIRNVVKRISGVQVMYIFIYYSYILFINYKQLVDDASIRSSIRGFWKMIQKIRRLDNSPSEILKADQEIAQYKTSVTRFIQAHKEKPYSIPLETAWALLDKYHDLSEVHLLYGNLLSIVRALILSLRF